VATRTRHPFSWFPWLATLAALGALATDAGPARAQNQFRVTWSVERTTATHVEIDGRVFNDSPQDVGDLYVTAAAVDAAGKVLARGITFVASQLPARRTAEFTARVPIVRGATGYRVAVSSFRSGMRNESP
jgi:hypothetical protein